MGFFGFNFIETSFFISLGITFVLILLMVYHFKERMSCMEQKGDTMFEIINNIVREMTNLKNAFVIQQQLQQQSLQPQQPNITYSTSSVLSPRMVPIREHVVEYESGDETDSDSNSDSESLESGSEESESESETETGDAELMNDPVHNETIQIHFDTPLINDTQAAYSSQMEDDVKIINIHLDNYHTKPDYLETEPENQTADDTETDASVNEASINEETEYKEVQEYTNESTPKEEEQIQTIHVNKINNDEVEPASEPKDDDKKESYKELTIAQLKALVITKGITTSVSKLKKNELISLLENNSF